MTATPENDESTLAYLNLEPGQILTTLEGLGFRCDGRFLTLNSYENRVYQVGIEDEKPVVAKFYRPGRWSDEAILEEHAFSYELADVDIPVVAPIRTGDRTLHHAGHFRVSVSPCKGGRAPELDNRDLMRQLGRLVARIHLVGETKPFEHRPPKHFCILAVTDANRRPGARAGSGLLRVVLEAPPCDGASGRLRELRMAIEDVL